MNVLLLASCERELPAPDSGQVPFDLDRKHVADKIISCFENDDTTLQYNYIENLNDGRGYTAGRSGFTSANGDMLAVVELYTDSLPVNELAKYIPLLTILASNESSDTNGLEGLVEDWKTAANNPLFRYCQDKISDSLYYSPSVLYAKDLKLRYALSLLSLYDACIQHGDGDDPDGLSALITETNDRCGGSPADGINEDEWLCTFNHVRKKVLRNPDNTDTEQEWKESVGRVSALEKLRKHKSYLLNETPLSVNPYGTEHLIQ